MDRLVDGRTRGWFWVDNRMFDPAAPQVGANGLLVYVALCRMASVTGQCWPSHKRLAALTQLSVASVRRALDALVKERLVTRSERVEDNGEQTSNLYILSTPLLTESTPPAPIEQTPCSQRATKDDLFEGRPIEGKREGLLTLSTENRRPSPRALFDLWNQHRGSLPAAKELTLVRARKASARLRERPLGEWEVVIQRMASSSFCKGETSREGWRASFDWLISSADVAVKVLEGKYDGPREQTREERSAEILAALQAGRR